jgi:hypothetical protein
MPSHAASTQKVTSSRVTCQQHLSATLLPCTDLRSSTRLHGTYSTSCASLSRCVAGLSGRRRMLLKHGGKGNEQGLFPLRDIQAKRERANFPVRPSASHPMAMGRWRVRLAAHKGCEIIGIEARESERGRTDNNPGVSGRQLTWQSRMCR